MKTWWSFRVHNMSCYKVVKLASDNKVQLTCSLTGGCRVRLRIGLVQIVEISADVGATCGKLATIRTELVLTYERIQLRLK